MANWRKKSSGKLLAGTHIIVGRNCVYFGFTLVTGGSNRIFKAYNSLSAKDGKEIEDMVCDGNKPTDGHSHSNPVECPDGLTVVVPAAATAVVYYYDEIT